MLRYFGRTLYINNDKVLTDGVRARGERRGTLLRRLCVITATFGIIALEKRLYFCYDSNCSILLRTKVDLFDNGSRERSFIENVFLELEASR